MANSAQPEIAAMRRRAAKSAMADAWLIMNPSGKTTIASARSRAMAANAASKSCTAATGTYCTVNPRRRAAACVILA